jgi:hypothetical protein
MTSDLYAIQNEWYKKLKELGFKDIELSWAKGNHTVRKALPSPHPSGKRKNKKMALSGDTAILLERYCTEYIIDSDEAAMFADVSAGMSIRKSAVKNSVKIYRAVYLINKAMRKIKADLLLWPLPEYLRCPENEEEVEDVEG